MKHLSLAVAAAIVSSFLPVAAEPEGEIPEEAKTGFVEEAKSGFGGWRVSAGGNIGFGLKTKMRFKTRQGRYAGPVSPEIGTPADMASRLASGERLEFLDGAYIDPDGEMAAPYTKNWRIPASSLDRSTGEVVLNSAQAGGSAAGRGSDDDVAYGAQVELARTLWAHEKGFGVDFAVGLSWMRANNCFKAKRSGVYSGKSTYTYAPSDGSANKALLTSGYLAPQNGFYGAGSPGGMGPVLDWSDFGPDTVSQTSGTGAYKLDASGDYEEWALSLMLKPWWEVTDWWRLNGTIGVGVARSEFDCTVSGVMGDGGRYSSHDKFHKWQCYGIGGVGTVFRLWRVDLSFDVLARFLQDDMHIRSKTVSGKIEKPDVVVCIAMGFEF